jgi:hypothetical protein
MSELGPLTTEGVRALAADLVAVVRRYAPGWTARADDDPGIILVELFAWLADTLVDYQARIANEAALGTRRRLGVILHHVMSDVSPVVTVDGVRWHPIAAETPAASGDRVYVVEHRDNGTVTLAFGDGGVGARPPVDGSEVAATYRSGTGAAKLTVTFRWPPDAEATTVRLAGGRIAFGPARAPRRGFIAALLDRCRRSLAFASTLLRSAHPGSRDNEPAHETRGAQS